MISETIGRYVTSPEAQDLARMANEGLPKLRTHGPRGERLDMVEFHPAWHALMRRSVTSGLHASAWENIADERGRSHKARALRFYLTAQLECGHLCPLTMTSASVAAISASPAVQKEWAPKILSRKYDSSNRPWMQKASVTIGMGMTEKQGGTDVRANTSTAERVGEGIYRLNGHKWFMSAPMSDAFVMLAQTRDGLGCFLVPRLLEDGSANGLRFQRLKDKLGNRSNASSEVEFSDTFGFVLGSPDAGIRTILDMVTLTRLDCALASAGMMRASLAEAVHHVRGRKVSGKALVAQPMMTRVLADMALDVAAASALSFRLAEAFDRARDSAEDAAYARIMTPVAKYWNCKIAPALIAEAMECIGGSGYVEERPIARHYREAPVNAIWEGSRQRHGARRAARFDPWKRPVRIAVPGDKPRSRPFRQEDGRCVAGGDVALRARRGGSPHAGRAAGARCRRCRTLPAGGRADRRCLPRIAAGCRLALDLWHARFAL